MGIYGEFAPKYFERSFLVTPVIGKAPYLKDWANVEIYKDFKIDVHANRNMGLLLGEPNGIIAVDIDKESALEICPPSPVRKKGEKGETRFFKYNGEISRKRLDLGIEILSTGNQTILPPSIHPKTQKPYVWITPDTLLDFDKNDLPVLPNDFLDLINNGQQTGSKITQSDGTRCNNGSHNQLSSMLSAAIRAGDPPSVIVKNLLEYDSKINPDISYFTCPGRPEWKVKNREANALKFVTQGFESHIKRGEIKEVPIEATEFSLDITQDTEVEYKRLPLPRLLGMGQKMFEYLYSMSSTPKSHQVFSYIMSLSSVLMSNRYKLEGTFSNTFTIVFSDSGGGKNEGQDFIRAILEESDMAHLIGESLPGGSTAMIMNLPSFRERLDIVSEGTKFFQAINSHKEYKSEMALVYSDLFNAGGKGFYSKSNQQEKKDDKKNVQGRIGECFSPCVSLLITINMASSKTLINTSMYEQGFMARLNVRIDSDRKKRKPYGGSIVDNIPQEFISFIKSAGPVKKEYISKGKNVIDLNIPQALKKFHVPEIPVDKDAMNRIKEIEKEIIEMEYNTENDDVMVYVIRRAYENFKKTILCITPLSQSKLTDLKVTTKEVEWAWELTKVDLNNHKVFIKNHLTEFKIEATMKKILDLVNREKKVERSAITRKIRDKKEREEAIFNLKEGKYIKEIIENRIYFYTPLRKTL